MKIKQVILYFVYLLLATTSTTVSANVSVLQYNASTNTVKRYEVPLDLISYIIVNGKYAWAVETIRNQPGMTVSVFDGSSWSSAINTNKLPEGFRANTYVNGSYAALSYCYPKMDLSFSNNTLLPNNSGSYSWQETTVDTTTMAHGRVWQLQNGLQVNQTEDSLTLSPITDPDSAATIRTLLDIDPSLYYLVPYYNKAENTDYAYIYGYKRGNTKEPTDSLINLTVCSMPHNSPQIAKDVRCSAIKKLDLTKLISNFPPGKSLVITNTIQKNGNLVFNIEMSGSKYDSINYYASVWTTDLGQTWSGSDIFSDNDLFGYDAILSSENLLPNRHNGHYCLYQKAQTIGYNQKSFLIPSTFPCLDLSSAEKHQYLTNYYLQATDIDENTNIWLSVANNGIWLTRSDGSLHLYYIPFDSSKSQIELPAIPSEGQRNLLKFAVFSNTKSSDSIVACGYSNHIIDGVQTPVMQAATAKNNNGKWSWLMHDDSVIALNTDERCQISNDQYSPWAGGPSAKNFVFDKSAVVWLYPQHKPRHP